MGHNKTCWKDEDQESVFKKFHPMKKYRRRLVHELAALYGFQGVSIDIEPNRYCHIFAPQNSGSCKLPKILLSDAIKKINFNTLKIFNLSSFQQFFYLFSE